MSIVNLSSAWPSAVLGAVLLAGCDGRLLDASALALPDCQDGQLLTVNPDRSLSCVSVLAKQFPPPVCNPVTQVLTSELRYQPAVVTARCVARGAGISDQPTINRISDAATAVANLATSFNNQQNFSGRSLYVGRSSQPTKGQIFFNAVEGLRAATKLCEADYGLSAHMCTPFEIYNSVVAGDILDGTADAGPSWVYMEGYNDPTGMGLIGGSEPYAGLMDNCGGYTSSLQSTKWRGTTFLFAKNGGTDRVPQFNANTACYTMQPIACCRQP